MIYSIDLPKEQLQLCPGCVEAVSSLSAGGCPKEDELILVGELSDSTSKSRQFYTVLREELLKFVSDPLLSLIQPRQEDRDAGVKFSRLFAAAEYKNNSKVCIYTGFEKGCVTASSCKCTRVEEYHIHIST